MTRLRRLRIRKGLTQLQLARKIGVAGTAWFWCMVAMAEDDLRFRVRRER
jgi:transcriptional regulator with XRE-family HTH domain